MSEEPELDTDELDMSDAQIELIRLALENGIQVFYVDPDLENVWLPVTGFSAEHKVRPDDPAEVSEPVVWAVIPRTTALWIEPTDGGVRCLALWNMGFDRFRFLKVN